MIVGVVQNLIPAVVVAGQVDGPMQVKGLVLILMQGLVQLILLRVTK